MILTLTDTQTDEISAKIDELHEERGEAALGRVLTLVVNRREKPRKFTVHCQRGKPRSPMPCHRHLPKP